MHNLQNLQPDYAIVSCDLVEKYKKFSSQMASELKSLVMTSEFEQSAVHKVYSECRTAEKTIDENRKLATSPLRQQIEEINSYYNQGLDVLRDIISLCKEKSTQYTMYVEEKHKKEVEEANEFAELLGLKDTFVPEPSVAIKSQGTTSTVKIVKKYRLSDISKVPHELLMLDEKKVKAMMQLTTNIPGIEIYEEKVTTLRKT